MSSKAGHASHYRRLDIHIHNACVHELERNKPDSIGEKTLWCMGHHRTVTSFEPKYKNLTFLKLSPASACSSSATDISARVGKHTTIRKHGYKLYAGYRKRHIEVITCGTLELLFFDRHRNQTNCFLRKQTKNASVGRCFPNITLLLNRGMRGGWRIKCGHMHTCTHNM